LYSIINTVININIICKMLIKRISYILRKTIFTEFLRLIFNLILLPDQMQVRHLQVNPSRPSLVCSFFLISHLVKSIFITFVQNSISINSVIIVYLLIKPTLNISYSALFRRTISLYVPSLVYFGKDRKGTLGVKIAK
jgi:hypothetical protein